PTAPTGVVPLRVAPPGLLPRATPTAPVNPAATLPKASSARTFTAGLIWWFATVVPGSVPNTSSVAVPAVIVKALLVALESPAGRRADPAHRPDGRRAAEGRAAWVVARGDAHAAGESRRGVTEGVERADFHRRADLVVRHGGPGLGAEHQLRRGPGGDVEGAARRPGEPGRAGGEPVARACLADGQVAERRHAIHRRDRRRAAERAAFPRGAAERHGHVPREGGHQVLGGVEGRHPQRRCERGPGGGRGGLDGELELRRGPGRD